MRNVTQHFGTWISYQSSTHDPWIPDAFCVLSKNYASPRIGKCVQVINSAAMFHRNFCSPCFRVVQLASPSYKLVKLSLHYYNLPNIAFAPSIFVAMFQFQSDDPFLASTLGQKYRSCLNFCLFFTRFQRMLSLQTPGKFSLVIFRPRPTRRISRPFSPI